MAELDTFWWDLRDAEPDAPAVSVAFSRWPDARRACVRLCTTTCDANDIAHTIEGAFDLPPVGEAEGVQALLICNGSAFPLRSPRLAMAGAALLRLAQRFLTSPSA